MNQADDLRNPDDQINRKVEHEILRAIKGIRYGSVEVTIHDSKVIQIERKEKVRFDKDGPGKGR